ncbi:four-carbon acid sugar kinase family protein [Sphingobacterium olei]|uniref:Four-carbon acid sugar kinase family protein n=1 Tax=Sphingobacterium olei TaxID=2571155 RepID=A0A4U0P7U7_9SPHI|nr:four-carbon acid sugar kinase family protein [Sphingobacterium olei]TJZ63563.1 four-carbon acid sugar kinase family protein [Sphingobacterium olei]
MEAERLFLAFYGDDFTGSTDALDFLSRAGIKTILFIDIPNAERLKKFEGVQAIGIAGTSRSMSPDEMENELSRCFDCLRVLNPKHVHYKICSTFDSAPHVGSIGKAIDIGYKIFKNTIIPMLVAAPALGRYCSFGNLFARMGIGSSGEIYRLDRHPSMRYHPTTPANESDLRIHLSQQTDMPVELLDLLDLEKGETYCIEKLTSSVSSPRVVLFDTFNESHLSTVGTLIDQIQNSEKPLFSVGSSGIEMALAPTAPSTRENGSALPLESAIPILVISGSCSPVTGAQINHALTHGFAELALETSGIVSSENQPALIDQYAGEAIRILNQGMHLVIHTSKGPEDVRIASTNEVLRFSDNKSSSVLGTFLGSIVNRILEKVNITRIIITGGDTSGFVAKAMGIEALEMRSPFVPGAPICKAHTSYGYPAQGIEVNFKGGQVGTEDYFVRAIM